MKRRIDPTKYELPFDTVDLTRQRCYIRVGGKFFPIPNAKIVLDQPADDGEDHPTKSPPLRDSEVINALLGY